MKFHKLFYSGLNIEWLKWDISVDIPKDILLYNYDYNRKEITNKIYLYFSGQIVMHKGLNYVKEIFDYLSMFYDIELTISGKGPDIDLVKKWNDTYYNIKYIGFVIGYERFVSKH